MTSSTLAPLSTVSASAVTLDLPPAERATSKTAALRTQTLTEGPGALGAKNGKNNFAGIDAAIQGPYKLAKAQDNGSNETQLFVLGEGDFWSIEPGDVKQGTGGTCTIMAAIAGLANTQRGRMLLTRIARDNGNGTITVKLWGEEMVISVDKIKTMPSHVGDFNGKPKDPRWEIWPMAIEAGYARGAHDRGIDFHRVPVNDQEGAPIELGLNAVTNQPVTVKPLVNIAPRDTIATLGLELSRGKLITAATHVGDGVKAWGLLPRHAYAVLGVNTDNNTVELFDPHGKKVFVTLEAFRRCFNHVGWSQIP